MELLVKPEILTSYIYGLTFGNAESRLFVPYKGIAALGCVLFQNSAFIKSSI
jgi:hypothetical protein